MRPARNSYGDYYKNYITLVNDDDLLLALENSANRSLAFWADITEEQGRLRYAEGKWSIKELLQHIIDTERVFSYRALVFARGETTELPGYDENVYTDNCFADERTFRSLVDELKTVRQATLQLFKSFKSERLDLVGTASNSPLSARAAGFIIIGHEMHHANVVKERYLKPYELPQNM
jgi:uncharacterized damage-inducible protein DinB